MKNLDINNLTKVELINEIINLTNKCNECIRLRGYLNTHKVLSANTLRTKKREFLEKQFEQSWGWLYEEVRANYSILPINIDKQALDTIKAKSENATEENFKEYRVHLDRYGAEITELIHSHIINQGMLDAFPDIKIDDVIVISLSGKQVRVGLWGCVDHEISYYHNSDQILAKDGEETKNIDKIDFGMVGTFDLDSERGHQQLFLMSLLSYIGSNGGLRTKINEILEDIHDKNLTRVRTNNDIQHSMTQDIDRIILPYIKGVATGEFE